MAEAQLTQRMVLGPLQPRSAAFWNGSNPPTSYSRLLELQFGHISD